MGKSAPSSPDPYKTADAQFAANKKALSYTANVNAVNQYSPYGSTTFKKNKLGVPTRQTVTLNPADQAALGQSRGVRSSLLSSAQAGALKPFQAPDDSAKIADTMYQRKLGMVSPELDRAQKSLDQQLMDRGLPIGSEVYNDEQNRIAKTRGDTLASISQDSILAGGQEQDRQLQNAITQYERPMNEALAWQSGNPMQTPQFSNQPGYNVQAPDVAGQVNQDYQNQLAQYNSQQGSLANGLFGLGSAAITAMMHSDRRLKKDIKKIGKMDSGLNLFKYRYKWEGGDHPEHVGFMSDEVRDVAPWAVAKDSSGYDMVNYSDAAAA